MRTIFSLILVSTFLGGCVRLSSYSPSLTYSGTEEQATPVTQPNPDRHRIRVAIVVRQAKVHLLAPENFILSGFPLDGTPVVKKGLKSFHEATLTPDQLYAHKAYIETFGEGEIQVNGKSYRGSMEIVEDKRGTLTVINELPLEEYVMGVLAGEIPRNWPLEALKAQAVAARTFAVLNQSQARKRGDSYDLENTAFYQMYRGSDLVNGNIQKAVEQTQGEILTYHSAPIMAFFHSNCGGKTSGAQGVWSKDEPYLKPVDCPFGNDGEHFRWRTEMKTLDLARKLRGAGLSLADVARLEPLARDESNRIVEIEVMDEKGHREKMKGSAFRMAVGPDLIRSTRFDPIVQNDKVVFSGKGWGHGVGLCQEGAHGMALKGYRAFDILRHYYPGIMVEKLRENENQSF